MALRKRLADEITLFSKDKHMLLKLIDDRIAASQPNREAVARLLHELDRYPLPSWDETEERLRTKFLNTADAILSLLSVQVDGEQKITPLTKPSPSSTSATATETAGWHPIETAPKDGPDYPIQICGGGFGGTCVAYWTGEILDATHWAPMKPPVAETDADAPGDAGDALALVKLADNLRAAQRAYMSDRGNDEKGRAVALAAEAYDASRLVAQLSTDTLSSRSPSLHREPLLNNSSDPTLSAERMREALEDWLAYADANLSEFDVDGDDCDGERLGNYILDSLAIFH